MNFGLFRAKRTVCNKERGEVPLYLLQTLNLFAPQMKGFRNNWPKTYLDYLNRPHPLTALTLKTHNYHQGDYHSIFVFSGFSQAGIPTNSQNCSPGCVRGRAKKR